MQVTLTVIAGPHAGREFSFSEHSSFLAGRSKMVQFRLSQKDQYFSRVHFLVELNPPLCRIIDLHSRNGTFVNGQRISTAELQNGDRIKTGQTVIQVAIDRALDQVAAVPRPPAVVRTPRRTAVTDVPGPATLSFTAAELLPPDYRQKIEQHPQPIEGYSIIDQLGSGGMGVVYLAIRNSDQLVVALKTVSPAGIVTPTEVQKFRREALILSDLDHPHIVRFRDVGESRGLIYFAMEYVPGVDGRQLLRAAAAPLPVGRAVGIVCQLLKALEHAHQLGYVHRDIKPSNLLIHHQRGQDFVWLTDFGLARTYQASRLSGLTMTNEIGGTTPYMPPEQILSFRDALPTVDQYASAATLYQLLTNQNVYDFPPELPRQLLMILTESTVPIELRRSNLPPRLVQAINRALSRDPAERYPTIADFHNEIARYAG